MLKNLRAHLQYRFDEIFAKGAWGKLALLAVFTAVVVLLGMAAMVVGLFSAANDEVDSIPRDVDAGPLDALWWSFHHILDPAFCAESYGATWPVMLISLIVALGGMVVFGALVGFISSILDERLDVLRRGDSAVQERGHLLLLGWNAMAPRLIALFAERRRHPCIVVLAPAEIDAMQEDLRRDGADQAAAKIVLRSGSPANQGELARMACAQAAGVIVLPSDGTTPTAADAEVVRTLLVLADFPWTAARPRLVAEIRETRHAPAARLAGRGIVPVVAVGEVVALLLFQCSRQRGISRVFDEIIAPRGAGILVRPAPGCAGISFGDLAYAFRESVPLGISRLEATVDGVRRYGHILNPPRDRLLGEDEWLVFLARGDEKPHGLDRLRYRSTVALNHTLQPGETAAAAEATQDTGSGAIFFSLVATGSPLPPPASTRVLVLGWNEHQAPLLGEYDLCQGPRAGITVVSGYSTDEAAERLAAAGVVLRRIAPEFRRADTLLPGVIAELKPETFDAVVVLADTSWGDADPDARTVMLLLMLREHLRAVGARPRLSAEVLDHATGEAAASLGIDDLVVGPHLISQQLVQIAEQSMVAAVYDDLLSSGGMDVYLKPAGRYVRLDAKATFRDLIYSAQHLSEVAMGIWLARPRDGWTAGLHLAPPRTAAWEFEADDQIVVLAEDLYDVPAGGTGAVRRKKITPGSSGTPGSPG